ncbi:hypothetical protein LTS18_010790, partial [Coniosporium uncinatum]
MLRRGLLQSSRAIGARCASSGISVARSPVLAAAPKYVRNYAAESKASATEVSSILEQRISGVKEDSNIAETGRVLSVGDGIARVYGMT